MPPTGALAMSASAEGHWSLGPVAFLPTGRIGAPCATDAGPLAALLTLHKAFSITLPSCACDDDSLPAWCLPNALSLSELRLSCVMSLWLFMVWRLLM